MAASQILRLLQFVEALIAAAEAYHALHTPTKRMIDQQYPILGASLRTISDGFAQGICDAFEEEKRRTAK
jgi:hypothetical protein